MGSPCPSGGSRTFRRAHSLNGHYVIHRVRQTLRRPPRGRAVQRAWGCHTAKTCSSTLSATLTRPLATLLWRAFCTLAEELFRIFLGLAVWCPSQQTKPATKPACLTCRRDTTAGNTMLRMRSRNIGLALLSSGLPSLTKGADEQREVAKLSAFDS